MKKGLIIGGILLFVIVGFSTIIGGLYFFAYREIPMTEADRNSVVTVHDLKHLYEDFEPSIEYEVLKKWRYLDGTFEVDYEYDSPKDTEPFVSVTVSTESNAANANTVFWTEWTASTLVTKAMGVEVIERHSFYKRGDDSKFADLKNEFGVVGHIFLARKGKKVFSFIISGFTLTEEEMWKELFDSKIDAL